MAKRKHEQDETASGVRMEFERQEEQTAFDKDIIEIRYRTITPQYNIYAVLEDFYPLLLKTIQESYTQHTGLKVSLIIKAEYKNQKIQDAQPFESYLRTKLYSISLENMILETIANLYKEIQTRHENYMMNGSNCEVQQILFLGIQIAKFSPLSGAHYIPLPEFLAKKQAIVNVNNNDERCFGYAILSALLAGKCRPRARQLAAHFEEYHLNGIKYPVLPEEIQAIEQKINLSINLYTFTDEEGRKRKLLYTSKNTGQQKQEINLLFWAGHYAWIKNFSAFIADLAGKHCKRAFCTKCLRVFSSQAIFKQHETICGKGEDKYYNFHFPPQGTTLRFTGIKNQLKAPFAIYADFECILSHLERSPSKNRTTPYEAHLPAAVGFFIKSTDASYFQSRYEYYVGKDAAEWFLTRLLAVTEELVNFMFDNKRLVMTREDTAKYLRETRCSICGDPFTQEIEKRRGCKVRDHDHLTGKFRGAAHSNCNINLKNTPRIPVFIHNFRGYDSHLIALGLQRFPDLKTKVIGQGFEKYLILDFNGQAVFKDSYQFLAYSLDALCNELLRSGMEKFANLREAFSALPEEKFKLLLRKGVFPYEYFDSWEKLTKTELPPLTAFFSTLKQQSCTAEDYAHAQQVWREFDCKDFKGYMELYLKTDVFILADVFENFRDFSLSTYKLDPVYYVSSPHLSWDAMLLFTKEEIELIHDREMFIMIDKGIRGGVSMISHRYARANNPEMGKNDYNPNKPLSYIVYLDANNLYGWAMSQSLPINEFKWVNTEDLSNIKWKEISDTAPIGYILEVDLDYPPALHNAHQDYPLAPERRQINHDYYNDQQKELLAHFRIPASCLNVEKLFCHFLPRLNYVIHYRTLKYYLDKGMILKKIHRGISFQQKAWLAPYIIKNQDLRAKAKSDFEKNQPKLFNNAVYGKTCENQKKRTDFLIAKTKRECKKLVERPGLKGYKIFAEKLAAFEFEKQKLVINKPFYAGFTVLELSKLHMYKFHYDYIKKQFGSKAQLLFTDTDSLMYHIVEQNPYETFFADRKIYFDFASFPKENKYYDATNNKVIGMFKDEGNGTQVKELAALRPKMYSFLFAGPEQKEKHTAKGIQTAVSKKIRHNEFLQQLHCPTENRQINRRIGSKLHRIYSFCVNKRGLCSFDDKRVILSDGISSLPYGHHLLKGSSMTPIGLARDPTCSAQNLRVENSKTQNQTSAHDKQCLGAGNKDNSIESGDKRNNSETDEFASENALDSDSEPWELCSE